MEKRKQIKAENTSFYNFSVLVFTQALHLREVKAIINVCSLCLQSIYRDQHPLWLSCWCQIIISFTSRFTFPIIILACASERIPLLWSPSDQQARNAPHVTSTAATMCTHFPIPTGARYPESLTTLTAALFRRPSHTNVLIQNLAHTRSQRTGLQHRNSPC